MCNPDRAGACLRISSPSESPQYRRFDFAVREGEDPKTISSSGEAKKILLPNLPHLGRRYNIEQDIQFPEDCIDLRVLRSLQIPC
jgi:hypothetical protein